MSQNNVRRKGAQHGATHRGPVGVVQFVEHLPHHHQGCGFMSNQSYWHWERIPQNNVRPKGAQHSTTHRGTVGVVQFVEHLPHHPKVVGLSPARHRGV